jgi:hypothetical protein
MSAEMNRATPITSLLRCVQRFRSSRRLESNDVCSHVSKRAAMQRLPDVTNS